MCYKGVTEQVWNEFRAAPSAGGYFNSKFKQLQRVKFLTMSEFNQALKGP